MVVGDVIAREQYVVMGVLVIEAVADDVVHAGVSGDETRREVEDVEEGDTVEEVDVGAFSDGVFSAVEPLDSEEEEAEEENIDNRTNIIMQYFQ
ncbi:hypothetical protein NDU88_004372 [Pleurodeles waltl]|uniref:Uncharacterized protein n=1 Tax=Pleurodeles waltl TaxID=8319 RepID=A0AAV7LI13_PLEWA|nr:hypothetical protein NDU88_004372 [Pleurodeles waltl]